MEILNRVVRLFATLVPLKIRNGFAQTLLYAGEKRPAHIVIGSSIAFGLLLFIGGFVFTYLFSFPTQWWKLLSALLSVVALVLPAVLVFLVYFFKSESRTKQVEETLPDVLHMIAANLDAGMTASDAIQIAATHDFGPLTHELRDITSRSQSAVSFADLLLHTTRSIKSEALTRVMKLFSSSLRSGGHVADILEGLATDIRERQMLKKELILNTSTNAMFIMFTILVGTPVLLSISIYFVEIVTSLQETSGPALSGSFGLGLGVTIAITVPFLTGISYVMLFFTDLLASMFVGSMIEGDPIKGLKFALPLIFGSYVIFFIARFLISYFLGNPLA